MILQDNNGNNKIFIDENLEKYILINDIEDKFITHIYLNVSDYIFDLTLDNIILPHINQIHYDADDDKLYFYSTNEDVVACKIINENEIISLSLEEEQERYEGKYKAIELTTMKLPEFIDDGKYPKFEINISECTYSMRIYNNDHEYLDIPKFQSHYSIYDTLEYIKQLVFYVTLDRPDFIKQLCEYNSMDLFIYDASHEKVLSGGEVKYKLGEEGLYLTGGELDNFLVEWHKFFKLVIDGTWEVDFYDQEQASQPVEKNYDHVCITCANYTDPYEVDNGCYMCCKGLEDNYVPIEKE